ncbi:MAG: hypothetical protein ACOC5E_00515 [Acidobacteriota bacterium]
MDKRRSGEHLGHGYRCWLEPMGGRYRGWYRGRLNVDVGDRNFVDRLHSHTPAHDTAEEALDDAERRVKKVIEEVAELV